MNFNKLIDKAAALVVDEQGWAKHFTFILKKNNVIACGRNSAYKTHPLARKFNYRFFCIHSELAAVLNFPFPVAKLRDFDIINIRIRKNGSPGLAKPCNCCRLMLKSFGVSRVYYSDDNFMLQQYLL